MGTEGEEVLTLTGPDTEFLRRLRWRLEEEAERDLSPDEVKEKFGRITGAKDHDKFLKRTGIYVAGFMFLDPKTGDVEKLLFSSRRPESLRFGLNYVWPGPPVEGVPNEERAAALVDMVFRLWRETDNVRDPVHAPECFKHLPFGSESTSTNHALWSPSGVGCLHVPLGELKLFTYAWRTACRAAQYHGWAAPASCLLHSQPSKPAFDWIWSANLWRERGDRATGRKTEPRECILARFVSDAATEDIDFKTPNQVAQDFRDLERHHLNSSGGQAWLEDLQALGLVTEVEGTWRLTPAAASLVAFLERELGPSATNNPSVAELISELDPQTAPPNLTQAELQSYDLNLRQAALRVLRSQQLTVEELLDAIHLRARFPIYPYFYWYAVHRAEKVHLSIPVWHTVTEPVYMYVQENSAGRRVAAHAEALPVRRPCAVVGVAVVGARPFADPKIDFTYRGSTLDGETWRSENLCRYLQELGRMPADAFFNTRLQKTAQSSIAKTLAHDTKNWLSPFTSLIDKWRTASGQQGDLRRDMEFASLGLNILRGVSMGVHTWIGNRKHKNIPQPTAANVESCLRFLLCYHIELRRRGLTTRSGDWTLSCPSVGDQESVLADMASSLGVCLPKDPDAPAYWDCVLEIFEARKTMLVITALHEPIRNIRPEFNSSHGNVTVHWEVTTASDPEHIALHITQTYGPVERPSDCTDQQDWFNKVQNLEALFDRRVVYEKKDLHLEHEGQFVTATRNMTVRFLKDI